jgi:8-oxo-dGTP pyrophosphatase MutT (NUDIX family)
MTTIHVIARAYIRDNDHLLLAYNGHNFFLPGGHANYHEPHFDALKRELKEELGLSIVNIGDFVGVVENVWDNKGTPFHEQCFIFEVSSSFLSAQIPVTSKETHISFHWKTFKKIRNENFLPKSIDDFLANFIRTRKPCFHSLF